jgi:hypothetical protein
MRRSRAAALALCNAILAAGTLHAGECAIKSPQHRIAVLELYTSEGCNSCPPADRWFSSLRAQGVEADAAVLLAFHVDYWNNLGWPDLFSKPAYSARQREAASRVQNGIVYTPQVLFDGIDYRQRDAGRLRAHLAEVNRDAPKAHIRARVQRSGDDLQVSGEVEAVGAPAGQHLQTWVATYENGLYTQVRSGENAGKRLNHDYVVRDFGGPFVLDRNGQVRFAHRVKLPRGVQANRLGMAIFVEQANTGSVLQAASLYPLCSQAHSDYDDNGKSDTPISRKSSVRPAIGHALGATPANS